MPIIQTVIQGGGGGITPSGTISITSNGTYSVTSYATAQVNVSLPGSYLVLGVDSDETLSNSTSSPFVPLPSTAKNVGQYVLYRAYAGTPANVLSGAIDLSNIEALTNGSACLETFLDCPGITSADLSLLTTLTGNGTVQRMFSGCTGMVSVRLDSLAIITAKSPCNYWFGNTSLASLSFPSLKDLGSYKTQFSSILFGVDDCTLHFPANMQSVIELMNQYPNFGGTNTTVLFDLPSTVTLTGADTIEYSRNPKYDTATALAWKVGAYGTTDFTPAYYTSGTTDPVVSDTIFSDAACTTAVTTIDTIS